MKKEPGKTDKIQNTSKNELNQAEKLQKKKKKINRWIKKDC